MEKKLMPAKTDHDLLTEIHSAVMGVNGQGGILRELKNHNGRIHRIELILAGMAGSGLLGGGIFGLVKLFTG